MHPWEIKWARTTDTLHAMVQREGARPRDIELDTEKAKEVPWKDELEAAWEMDQRRNRWPFIWVTFEDWNNTTHHLGVTLMRFWASCQPVASMPQFMSRWRVIGHEVGRQVPMAPEWLDTEKKARRFGKKWGVYGLWPKGQGDGVVISNYTWYMAERSYVQDRERKLSIEDDRLARESQQLLRRVQTERLRRENRRVERSRTTD